MWSEVFLLVQGRLAPSPLQKWQAEPVEWDLDDLHGSALRGSRAHVGPALLGGLGMRNPVRAGPAFIGVPVPAGKRSIGCSRTDPQTVGDECLAGRGLPYGSYR